VAKKNVYIGIEAMDNGRH